ncbi:MAG: helix-turn-helix transcriptional regulator [Clostridiales bacterium]|nr:helix-turn-helix transcriptional regulator [Clostridiales bacterium]
MRLWLLKLRKEHNLSIEEAAHLCGISRTMYYYIESGERGVRVPTAKKIAAALGFDWQRFYED